MKPKTYLRGTRLKSILPHKLAVSKPILTSRVGLIVVAQLMQRLGLAQLVDQQLPTPGSNRGYRQAAIFNIFMLLFHVGGRCLDDVSYLEKEKPLMELLGCGQLPAAKTLGNWLRRVGRSAQGMQGLVNINKKIPEAALKKRKQITLDIDATVIESNKRRAKFTYEKHRGYTPMIDHIGETGQVVAAEFREGNESANKNNLEFIQRCQSALPDGVLVSHVRIDAAGYQAAVINHAMDNDMGFAIRAKMDGTVKETISGIQDCDWRPLVYRDGSESDTEQVARSVHVMNETPQAFTLVVQSAFHAIRFEKSFGKTRWSFDTTLRALARASWMRIGRTWRSFYPTIWSGRFEIAVRFFRCIRRCQLRVMRAVMRACAVMRASGLISKAAGYRKPMCRWSFLQVKPISSTGVRSRRWLADGPRV